MSEGRLRDYLDHMRQAARDACQFVEGMSKEEFLRDKRTQQAVVMSLIIIGEAATKAMDTSPGFAQVHPQVPWRNMRGMRNRIAHGYDTVDDVIVFETVTTRFAALLEGLDRELLRL